MVQSFDRSPLTVNRHSGGLAQLARAPALQAGGQRFESVILHQGENRMTKAQASVNPKPDTKEGVLN